jgi:hypothetical protein
MGAKYAYFEKWSMTVRITDFQFMRGKPSMKSMDTCAQTALGMTSGCSMLIGCKCSTLLL